jgi:tRNA (guanine37-N1)-methyltransferase
LLSGHHGNVDKWRREQALLRTWQRRPELLKNLNLSDDDLLYLRNLGAPLEAENEANKSAE